jgi:hypothetical protein
MQSGGKTAGAEILPKGIPRNPPFPGGMLFDLIYYLYRLCHGSGIKKRTGQEGILP